MEAAGAIRGLVAEQRARSFERECEQLRPLGEAYVLRRFGGSLNRADAEDAVADVLIRLHRRMADGRAPDNLRAAFFTSVRNAAVDQLRARASRPSVGLEVVAEAPAFEPSPLERAESHEDATRLQEALGRMRTNYREAIVLRFGLGLTVPEISDRLGISLPAAKKLVLRATQQVRKRLESIEGEEFCSEMQSMARRSLFEKEASGLATAAEAKVLHAHFKHCGTCRSFLSNLHDGLHELGGAALLFAGGGGGLSGKLDPLDHLLRWSAEAAHGVSAATAKVRLTAYKLTGAFQPGDAGNAGLLASGGQKIAAICTAGAATTATCLATGIVGPGIGVSDLTPTPSHHELPAHVREVPASSEVWVAPPPAATASAASASSSPTPTPAPANKKPQASKRDPEPQHPAESPAAQSQKQFGFENTPSSSAASSTTSSSSATTSASAPEPAPEPAPAPAPAPSGGGGGGSSAGSGTESFGFGG